MPDMGRYRRAAVISHPCHGSRESTGLTTPTSVLYAGYNNHNREENIMPDITLKNGDISAYGLA